MHKLNIKIILGFKHIRFKCQMNFFSTKSDQIIKNRSSKLAELLDCSSLTAKDIIHRNKRIISLDSDEFMRNILFCKENLKFSDIVEYPVILSLNSSILQHRYYSLKELGCTTLKAYTVLMYPQIFKKTPQQLRKDRLFFSSKNLDCFNNLIINMGTSDRQDLISHLSKLYEDGCSLGKIKETMNSEAFSLKLESSLYKQHLMYKKCYLLRLQSIRITFDVLDLLFKDFNLRVNQVFQFPYILTLLPEHIQQLKINFPTLLGKNLEEIVRKMPTILKQSKNSLKQIVDILEEFKISGKQIMVCPRILSFCPNVLRQRLEYLCNSEHFSLLKSYEKFLWLIYYFNNIEPRLAVLKAANIPCSISMFITSRSNFEKYLGFTKCKTHLLDICHHLSQTLGCTEYEANHKLSEFPNRQSTCLLNCSRVVNYLLAAGVTKRQIFNGLGIIFYDFDVVKSCFHELEQRPECQPYEEWREHYNLVQLLVYVIEAENGFRGCRLYKEKLSEDEDSEYKKSVVEC